MDHALIVEALQRPETYKHQVGRVDLIQTHISSIFLTGKRAYKVKKPVDFGFLNFSTLELRRRYCQAEIELNRRLAPGMYLSVEPLTFDGTRISIAGEGEVVDWVVVMQQLDDGLLGVRFLEDGHLTEAQLDQLVDLLVPFYRSARSGEGVDEFGTIEAVRFNTDENFVQTESYVGKLLSRERYVHIQRWTNCFYDGHQELFRRRIAEGRVREFHGDLHLDNIFFCDPPVVFDCIEFSARLNCGDVAADLAFLAMDLDSRDRSDLASYFIDQYVKRSGDGELLDLLVFYKCYRAYVRGKVSAFTSGDPALTDTERRRQRNLARHYFELAYRYAGGTERPPLVVLYGLMGTGKSTLAQYLREAFGWHLISTDTVRKQIARIGEDSRVWVPYNEGIYSPEMNRRTYEEVCRRARALLAAGLPVAVDGAFKTREERRIAIDTAEQARANIRFIETVCDPATQQSRLAARSLHDTRSDGRIELMDRQRREFEPPGPSEAHLIGQVSTDGHAWETRKHLVDHLVSAGLLEDR